MQLYLLGRWRRAQQSTKVPTIGFLGSGTLAAQSQWVAALLQRLRELGWIEGRTVAIEYRRAEGRTEIMGRRISLVTSTLYRPVRSDHRPVPPTLQVANSR
jgi:hypothetical protein